MAITEQHLKLDLHPLTLSFQNPLLDNEFKSSHDYEVRVFNRIGILLSYFAWILLGIFSYVNFHYHFMHVATVIVITLYPIFTVNLLVLSSERYVGYFQILTSISNCAAGLIMIYVGQFILGNNTLTICGETIVILFSFFILRLRHTIAVLTTLSYVIAYQLALLMSFRATNVGLLSFLLWVVECTCIVGGNILERANRKAFFHNKILKHQAYHDTLTGLPNRFRFSEQLKLFVESHNQMAVLFIDLDQFKMINDTRGHTIGDQILQQAAQRLVACVGTEGIVSRFGGDEFTVVLPMNTQDEIAMVAEHIVSDIRRPFFIGNSEFYLRTSIGISLYPTNGTDIDTLIKNSDMAMYGSKASGGNNYQFFSSSMNHSLEERVNLERLLHTALANHEFVMYYQPQIDLRTRRVSGVEALIRWVHPERGLISPDQFIPIAEETGLIVSIGEWALRTACMQAKKWNREHQHPVHLSVNLSVKQFLPNDIVASVDRVLRETGLSPNLLELELTESIILQNTDSVLATMHRLKKLGVRISIDDFGTGYSSLAYLKDFPIDSLKIDRSFIHSLPHNDKNAAIISAIITLARNLGLKSVAEGVETTEQLHFFETEDCDVVQGYYFSRPLPEDQINDLLGHSMSHIRFVEKTPIQSYH